MPDHFAPRTRRVLMLANDVALRHGLKQLSDVLLLIAILEEGECVAATLLEALGVEAGPLYRLLPAAQVELHVIDLAQPVGLSPELRAALLTAEVVAAEYGADQVGTEHLLLGLVRGGKTRTARFLTESGVTEAVLLETAARLSR